jgi:hypothetical protein
MRHVCSTASLQKKLDPLLIKKTSRHVKLDTLSEYDQRENDFEEGAGGQML